MADLTCPRCHAAIEEASDGSHPGYRLRGQITVDSPMAWSSRPAWQGSMVNNGLYCTPCYKKVIEPRLLRFIEATERVLVRHSRRRH